MQTAIPYTGTKRDIETTHLTALNNLMKRSTRAALLATAPQRRSRPDPLCPE
jgi:hypothetical protein